jgi:hypothetical protein
LFSELQNLELQKQMEAAEQQAEIWQGRVSQVLQRIAQTQLNIIQTDQNTDSTNQMNDTQI